MRSLFSARCWQSRPEHLHKRKANRLCVLMKSTSHKLALLATVFMVMVGVVHAQHKESPGDYVRTPIEEPSSKDRETSQYVATGESWPAGIVYWYYNPLNQPANLKTAEILAAIQTAASRWAQMCNISFVYMGAASTNRGFDGSSVDRINVIGWASFPFSERDTAGITYWNYSRSTLAIVDADIILNNSGRWSLRDVDAVMTHEIGHMIGLDHSNTTVSIMSANPYNSYEYQRTLRGDDVEGCTKLYGASPLSLINRTLNWAEKTYPAELKSGPSVTQGDADGFIYRQYSGSNSKAGVKNGIAYYTGSNGVMQNMGPLSGFTAQVQAAGF